MVALNDSNLVPRFPSRAHPRVQGSIFATKHQTVHQGPSLTRSVSHFQALQGKSTSSPKRLHRVDHSNQQYSILAISDSSGAVVERVAYQAYGQPTFTNAAGTTLSASTKATRYSYTGREWDPSLELHHFRARWMSGASGRFAGRDPIGYLEGLNMSSFLTGRSLNGLDPSGMQDSTPKIIFPTPQQGIPPIYVDEGLSNWPSVGALNNVCWKLKMKTTQETCCCRAELESIEFKLFVTVPRTWSFLDDLQRWGIYGHELRHLLNMEASIAEAFGKAMPVQCLGSDCTQDPIRLANQSIWSTLGPAFTHNWRNPLARPRMLNPPWGEPLDPSWPGVPTSIRTPGNPLRPTPNPRLMPPSNPGPRPGAPRHGQGDWYCPLDRVLSGEENWPDWQFITAPHTRIVGDPDPKFTEPQPRKFLQ